MRLIDANALLKSIEELQKSPWYKNGQQIDANPMETAEYMSRKDAFLTIRDLCIFRAPTVEAEPIRHGKWMINGCIYKCSICKYLDLTALESDYCPNCGAKMDGEENEK